MQISPETTSLATFGKVLADPDLRGLLNLEVSDETAERIVGDPGLVDAYYQAWRRHAHVDLPAEAVALLPSLPPDTSGSPLDASASAPPPEPPLDSFASAPPPPLSAYPPAPPPLGPVVSAPEVVMETPVPIAGGVWSVAFAPMILIIPFYLFWAIAGAFGGVTNAARWGLVAIGLVSAAGAVLGVVVGARSIRRGLRAPAGTARRRTAIAVGWLGAVLCSLTALWWLFTSLGIAVATSYM